MKWPFSKIVFCLSLCVTIIFILRSEPQAIRDIPEDNLAYPVLIKSGDIAGSGFFYHKEDSTYLITARHVLFQGNPLDITGFPLESIPESIRHKVEIKDRKEKNKNIMIFHGAMLEKERDDLIKSLIRFARQPHLFRNEVNSLFKKSQKLELNFPKATLFSYSSQGELNEIEVDLKTLYKEEEIRYLPFHDIALVRIGTPQGQGILKPLDEVVAKKNPGLLGLGKDTYKLFADVFVGNTVYVFGYPTSITINPSLNIQMPLLRKGIVAGKNNSLKVIILDCPMFYGNSGGLVLEVDDLGINGKKAFAIGVISQLAKFEREWVQNSGYSIAEPMDFVEELIRTTKSEK